MLDLRLGLRSVQGNDKPRVANQLDLRALYDWDGFYTSHLTAGVGVLDLQTPDSFATLTGITQEPTTQKLDFTEKRSVSLSSFVLEELVPKPGFGLSAGARVQLDGTQDQIDVRSWRAQANAQGGAVYEHGPFGAKLVYAQGFRPPQANHLYSTVGTLGNPALVPERSQDLATELRYELAPLTVHLGGNLTRISKLIVLVPIPQPSLFAYTPQNKGSIDVAAVFAQAELSASETLAAVATYHATWLDESDPLGTGIPLARHTASLAAVWRPARDLSLFARGSFASSRRLRVMTAADPSAYLKTDPTVRTAIGVTLSNVLGPLDLDLVVDNPLFLAHDSPYQLDGAVNGLVERRRYTEAFATLRYER
jgi:hypothetical protein